MFKLTWLNISPNNFIYFLVFFLPKWPMKMYHHVYNFFPSDIDFYGHFFRNDKNKYWLASLSTILFSYCLCFIFKKIWISYEITHWNEKLHRCMRNSVQKENQNTQISGKSFCFVSFFFFCFCTLFTWFVWRRLRTCVKTELLLWINSNEMCIFQ